MKQLFRLMTSEGKAVSAIDGKLQSHVKQQQLSTLALMLGLDENSSEEKIMKEAKAAGISENQSDTSQYRIGLCGELSNKTLEIISGNKSFKNPKLVEAKDKEGGNHYFIETDDHKIIEPTYKQFLYRLFVNPNDGEVKKNQVSSKLNNTDCIQKINQLEGVFIGKKEDLKEKVQHFLQKELAVNDKELIEETVQFWKPKAA